MVGRLVKLKLRDCRLANLDEKMNYAFDQFSSWRHDYKSEVELYLETRVLFTKGFYNHFLLEAVKKSRASCITLILTALEVSSKIESRQFGYYVKGGTA